MKEAEERLLVAAVGMVVIVVMVMLGGDERDFTTCFQKHHSRFDGGCWAHPSETNKQINKQIHSYRHTETNQTTPSGAQ